ncbi:MAG: hypothetical protein HC845_02955 [Akkermansiaceae bacterium]|nr:hypothetical protein [Akkermansiaceae bacterium]
MFTVESIMAGLQILSVALLGILFFMILRVLNRLKFIEQKVDRKEIDLASAVEAPPAIETSPGGAFEAFLEEDPARLKLTKSEQFKAYRKWRQEKGMNWSNS